MIYLVTTNNELFNNPHYQVISEEKSLEIMDSWKTVQYDSETDGRNPHINHLLCMQFGNDKNESIIDAWTDN